MADFSSDRPLGRTANRLAMASVMTVTAAMLALMLATAGASGVLAQGKPPLDEPGIPVRIRVPDLAIDLPVVSSERTVPGNARDYPLCDVAQYWTIYDLPGAPGTTWIYAHAQPGMFLPLFLSADSTDGAGLLGKLVTLQLRDGRLLRYRIDEVKQHAYDRRIALLGRRKAQRLVLQTSEGPPGTIPKLQVSARLVGAGWTDEPAPKAQPRACWQPRAATTAAGGRPSGKGKQADGARASAVPAAATTTTGGGDSMHSTSLVLGGAAVLLGATILAIYLVRRPPAGQRPPPVAQRPPPVAQRPPPVAQRRRP